MRRGSLRGLAAVLVLLAAGCAAPLRLSYPLTETDPVAERIHGQLVVDPYRWLEDSQDPRVQAWQAEQEALARRVLDASPRRERLIRRMEELSRYDQSGIPWPVRDGERLFWWAKRADQDRWVYYTRASAEAEPEVLLDPNGWDPRETLAYTTPSRDGRWVAYGVDRGGSENPELRIMEVETRRTLPDRVRGWRQRPTGWLPDGSGLYYTANPAPGEVPEGEEHYWVAGYLHRLGTGPEEDEKVWWDDEVKEAYASVWVSQDGRWEILWTGRFNKDEISIRPLGSREPPTPVAEGFDARYGVQVLADRILLWTDLDAPRGRILEADLQNPGCESWRELVPEREEPLRSMNVIDGKIYARYLQDAFTRIEILDLEGRKLRDLPLPGMGTGWVWGECDRPLVGVSYSSFAFPETLYTYDYEADRLNLHWQRPVDVDPGRFTAEQVFYESADGTRVPMFLVHEKDLKRDGRNPTYLWGYGGFNAAQSPRFVASYLPWLEAGGLIAVPGIRGGGEYGKEWWEAALKTRRQVAFDDFIAAAEWMIRSGYTRPDKLAVAGGSNGGLLVGAVITQRPELFGAAYIGMPLLDMVRYHLFGYANIWSSEYGNAEDSDEFAALYAYSPYHNVVDETEYPAVLLVGSLNDARVDPLHARKMAARLQAASTGEGPILLLVRGGAGHGGGTTLTDRIEEQVDVWSFLMDQVDL